MVALGQYIRDRRHALGLTQSAIERAFGIPQTYLSSVERGTTVLPSEEFRSRLATALQISTIDLLLAAGEVKRDDLMDWAHQAGIITPDKPSDRVVTLARELSEDDDASPRVHLASLIPWMTQREAEYLITMFEHLPTTGQTQRKQSQNVPEEFRRWRDRQDTVDVL